MDDLFGHQSGPVWTDENKAIFSWFEKGKGHLIVRARAGSGKSSCIIEGIMHAPEKKILVAAFNKDIQRAMDAKLKNACAQAKTLHALGFGFVKQRWPEAEVDSTGSRTETLINRAIYDLWPTELVQDVSKPRTYDEFEGCDEHGVRLGCKILSSARDVVPLAMTEEEILDVIYELDHVPETHMEMKGWTCQVYARIVLKAMELALEKSRIIDFADMVYLPLRNRWTRETYDLVCVDEAQDMNAGQLELARRVCKANGRIVVVGDDRQCQPPGTMVKTPEGEVPIENLNPGDKVVTWDRHSQVLLQNGYVIAISDRKYSGLLYKIKTDSCETSCTDSHKWVVRWANRSENLWVTYVMQKGTKFRVGQCRLFRKAPTATQQLVFGLSQRTRVERGEAAWILKVHTTKGEALAYEQFIAVKYGLPEMVFQEPHGIVYFTQENIEYAYGLMGDLTAKAILCLKDHGRSIDYPFWVGQLKSGRRTLYEMHTCNLLPNLMAVPVQIKEDPRNIKWEVLDISTTEYEGTVYSLDISTHHKYVADGIVTCNSIYSFRGADSQSLDRLKKELNAQELGLTVTWRCPQSIVDYAATLVPDIKARPNAPLGLIETIDASKLEERAQPGDFVLSRINAPLMKACLSLIRKGIRARILGKDIGQRLSNIAKKLRASNVETFYVRLGEWARREIARAKKAKRPSREQLICDQADTLRALLFNLTDINQLYRRIDDLFGDRDALAVQFSTVHKAKGLEADRVFILKDTLYAFKGKGKDPLEEQNIEYVAVTRAKCELIWVNGFNPKKKFSTEPQPWEDKRWDNPPWAEEDYTDDVPEVQEPPDVDPEVGIDPVIGGRIDLISESNSQEF